MIYMVGRGRKCLEGDKKKRGNGASIIEFHRIGMSEKNLLGIMAQNQIPVVSQL